MIISNVIHEILKHKTGIKTEKFKTKFKTKKIKTANEENGMKYVFNGITD